MRVAVDLDAALAYIRRHGDEIEQARLRYLLTGEPPTSEIVATLCAGQRPDGGWSPFWAQNYSSLDATCFHLAQAEQAGISRNDESVLRAMRFLEQRQASDGRWEEDASVAEAAPPWATPGNLAATLYLTANCSFWLAYLSAQSTAASEGGRLLQNSLDETANLPSFLQTHWLAAGLWYRLGHGALAERTLTALAPKISQRTPASSLSWLMTTLLLANVPPTHPLLQSAAALLAHAQRADGSWSSEDGPDRDTHVTVEAVRALRLAGVARPL